ncbi:MAG TPA: hypothetical protein DDX98_13670 [Bacteroidales bacterium]|jgi:uncharacterized Tic20 family protein|nr:hypothetical protein [Bacteroidales bacterium]
MIEIKEFSYKPADVEAEKASNAYVMSLVALMAGLPLPIVNLLATLLFFLNNLKSGGFVKWHCTQALLSQLAVFLMNSTAIIWTLSILFRDVDVTNNFIAYIITAFIFNLIEFVATIIAAVYTRKGKHVEWWFFSSIANSFQNK